MTANRSVSYGPPLYLLTFAGLLLASSSTAAAEEATGEQIYRQKCASCHGPAGEGTDKFAEPLIGNKSIAQLTKLIGRTMPEDKPGSLSPAESERVTAYLYDAFYSPAARERNKPPRIELARLTVRQYRNSLADLIGSFRLAPRWEGPNGLKGEYYKGRRFQPNERVVERTDAQVKFDFGAESPVPDKMEPHEFSMRWTGSLLAPETGEYEFAIHTDHAARLWVNNLNRPLIDAWVKSGKDTKYTSTIYLVAGRVYPLKLEYTKAKQGVDDSKKGGPKPPPAKSSIALEWKRPHRASEPVPSRNLSPNNAGESFIVNAPFPPDDRSYGWERGTTVSKEWDQAATEAAVDTAVYVAARINELAGTRDGQADRDAKIRAFCAKFAERAFRRPLTEEERKQYVDRHFEAGDVETAVKRVVLLVLKSPRFLYREVGATPDSYDVASRLSFSLWDSLPDLALLNAAGTGQLRTREQVATQAERMLADPRARTKLREFLLTWLKLDHVADVAKDAKRYPDFDAAVVSDLRTSIELFLDEVAGSEQADFRQLLLADHLQFNGRLAKFYGLDLPADADFQKVKLDPEQRVGVLTHPYLMAANAYTSETSPIHRGVFLARGVLGLGLRPPPDAFTPLAADLHPTLTTRERVSLQTKPAGCMNCHGVINPLGFTLENFDAVGRFRDKEKDKPIDSAGSYLTRNGKTVTFKGARELGEFLAGSEEVHDSFVEQMFHHLVQQSSRAYGAKTVPDLRAKFAAEGFNIRKLAVDVMAASALTARNAATVAIEPKVGAKVEPPPEAAPEPGPQPRAEPVRRPTRIPIRRPILDP